uniref:VWFA domain-containing protein n=1 Tax=Panagrolaimus sp. ES5 TaxID=591445 RepID=A0AC34FL58_9BILA
MVDYIGTLGADGGGDTPEKCFSALLDTVRAVPQGTNIYIFTDANSKNPELYPSIVAIAKTSTSIEDYRRLTIATDGQYFVSLGNEINNATAVITDKNWQTIILLSNISKSLNQSFFVDGSVDGVEISLSSSESYLSTLVVDIIDGNGDSVIMHGSAIIDNQNSKIYRFLINSTVSSPWTLIIENDRYLIDQITIRVQSSLTTNLMLVNSISQKPLIGSPLANEGYDIYVICEDCIDITDISVSTCGNFNIS